MPDIDFQKIELNLIPKKGDEPVVFYASQYETARPFIAALKWGDTEFAPGDDCYAEIDIRKNDDNLVVITEDVVIDNNEVSVILPVQAVTCIGKNLGQVKIYSSDDHLIAALNFILEVQADPLAGGVTSETAIDNLESQIEDIATEVIGENYYNKTKTDALLADKADKSELPDMTDYYTKTQTDDLLYDKVDYDELNQYYKKTEVDNLLNAKVDKTTLQTDYYDADYITTNFARKSFVENYVDATATASGNPCTFDTAKYHTLIPALTTNIVCGGGGGTPSTPIPIVGHSELNLVRCGKNLLPSTYKTTTSNNIRYFWNATGGGLLLKANVTYCISVSQGSTHPAAIYVQDYNSGTELTHVYSQRSVTYTPTTDVRVRFDIYYANSDLPTEPLSDINCQVELGSTATAYAPYNGDTFTVQFGQTVYGGVYDKSGRLTITHGFITYDGSNDEYWGFVDGVHRAYISISDIDTSTPDINIADVKANIYVSGAYSGNGNRITGRYNITQINVFDSNVNNISEWRALLSNTPMTVAYKLATPIVIDVPSISVFAEKGVNNITSDCGGDVNVSYKDTIQHYIDTRL